jgi:hypothetical protein
VCSTDKVILAKRGVQVICASCNTPNEDGRKLYAGTIEAGTPAELVLKWSLFLATAERGAYVATYRGAFLGPEPALENCAGALAA